MLLQLLYIQMYKLIVTLQKLKFCYNICKNPSSVLFLNKKNDETDIIYCTSRFIFQLW